MPRKGEIRVTTSLVKMREGVIWLQATRQCFSNISMTLLGHDLNQSASRKRALSTLTVRLQKSIKRKRRTGTSHVTVNIPRVEIESFYSVYQGALIFNHISGRTFWRNLGLESDFKRALRPRGRPRLSSDERADRLSGKIVVVNRQEKRVRKSQKTVVRDQTWSRNLRRRTQTVLTDTEGPPEI